MYPDDNSSLKKYTETEAETENGHLHNSHMYCGRNEILCPIFSRVSSLSAWSGSHSMCVPGVPWVGWLVGLIKSQRQDIEMGMAKDKNRERGGCWEKVVPFCLVDSSVYLYDQFIHMKYVAFMLLHSRAREGKLSQGAPSWANAPSLCSDDEARRSGDAMWRRSSSPGP